MRKKWFRPLLLLLCASTVALGAEGPSLRFRLSDDPVTLDWNLAHSSHETHVIMNLMEGLTEDGPDLVPKPALAEKWEISPDGKTYTFTLKQGITWSDGVALSAAQFRDSWIRLLSPKTKSSYASFLFDIENAEAFHTGKLKDAAQVGIKVLDDRQLQIKLKRVVPHFLHIPSFWVTFPIRSDLIVKYGNAWTRPGKIVTLGPYLLSDWKKGLRIDLKKNPNYYGWKTTTAAPGTPEKAEIHIIKDDAKARLLFRDGKLDFFLDATTEDLLGTHAEGIRTAQFPYLATYYLGFNVKSGPLKDAALRRALSSAVDRERIGATLQGGQAPAKCWVPPGVLGHRDAGFPEVSLFDARATLTKAGFPDGRGFPSLPLLIRKFDGAEKLGAFLKASFQEKLGLKTEVSVVGPAEFDRTVKSRKTALFIGHWGADYPDPANFFEVFLSQSGSNRTSWKNAEYDTLVRKGGATLDVPTRLSAYGAAEDLLVAKDAVIVPLFFRKNVALLGPNIRQLEISPLNYLFLKQVRLTP